MVLGKKKEKFYNCSVCDFKFSNLDVDRTCSNCFACTGCEIYTCYGCGTELIVKPKKGNNDPQEYLSNHST